MSIDLMTTVWKRAPYEGGALLVLLALADWAHDDGTHVFPSVRELAKKARLQERQTQRIVKTLVADEVLILVAKASGKRGIANEYRINVRLLMQWPAERVTKCQPSDDDVHNPLEAAETGPQGENQMSDAGGDPPQSDGRQEDTRAVSDGCKNDAGVMGDAARVTPATDTGVTHDTLTVIEPPLEPLSTQRAREAAPVDKTDPDDPPVFLRRNPTEVEQFAAAWPTSDQSPAEISGAWPRSNPPPIADMLWAVEAYKAEISGENAKRPKDNQRPWQRATNWLRNRRWEGYLAQRQRVAENANPRDVSPPWNGDAAGARLLEELGPEKFNTWLRPCKIEKRDGAVVITTVSKLTQSYIAANFIDHLERAFNAPVAVQ